MVGPVEKSRRTGKNFDLSLQSWIYIRWGEIVGNFSAETAQKWIDWKLGELYVVGWHRVFVFCIRDGLVAG